MKHEDLQKLSERMPFKWRVQSFSRFKPEATCVAYVDARQVMERLDEVCGIGGWQSKFDATGGRVFCSIGINVDGEWIWKSDAGSESQVEAEKGQASDAFKRAAVQWTIGRFLYSMELLTLKTDGKKEGKQNPHIIDDNGSWVAQSRLTDFCNSRIGNAASKAAKVATTEIHPMSKPGAILEECSCFTSKDEFTALKEWLIGEGIFSDQIKKELGEAFKEFEGRQ